MCWPHGVSIGQNRHSIGSLPPASQRVCVRNSHHWVRGVNVRFVVLHGLVNDEREFGAIRAHVVSVIAVGEKRFLRNINRPTGWDVVGKPLVKLCGFFIGQSRVVAIDEGARPVGGQRVGICFNVHGADNTH